MGDSRDPNTVRPLSSGDKIPVPGTGIEVPLWLDLSRRDILKIAGYGSLAAFIAACGGGTTTTTTTTARAAACRSAATCQTRCRKKACRT